MMGAAQPTIERFGPHPHLGRLVQPKDCAQVARTHEQGYPWAADNDAFNGWDEAAELRYVRMLEVITDVPGCRFVTLPDVVGDAAATAMFCEHYLPHLRERRLPVALVAQDGVGDQVVPWEEIDALFIGGTTDFKMGDEAAEVAREAKRRDKWLHMGRVNSQKRVAYAASLGCDSFDGSGFSKWSKTWLHKGLAWAQGGQQLALHG